MALLDWASKSVSLREMDLQENCLCYCNRDAQPPCACYVQQLKLVLANSATLTRLRQSNCSVSFQYLEGGLQSWISVFVKSLLSKGAPVEELDFGNSADYETFTNFDEFESQIMQTFNILNDEGAVALGLSVAGSTILT